MVVVPETAWERRILDGATDRMSPFWKVMGGPPMEAVDEEAVMWEESAVITWEGESVAMAAVAVATVWAGGFEESRRVSSFCAVGTVGWIVEVGVAESVEDTVVDCS